MSQAPLIKPTRENPDTWIWMDELNRFYYPPTLTESLGILPTAKSTTPKIEGLSLPGQGEPYDSCGSEAFFICLKCDHIEPVIMNCRRSACPKCYTTWAWISARRASLRIMKAPKVFPKELRRIRKPIHGMISLPLKAHDLFFNDYPKARKTAYKLLKKAGFKGALLIPHPWRQKCTDCGGEIIASWTVSLESKDFYIKDTCCVECGSKGFIWEISPHFHVVGYGWVEHTEEIEADTGYVIKNIGLINNVGGTIWYLLTHCGIQKGRQTITYFGLCAYNKYKSPPLEKEAHLICPKCGAFMIRPGFQSRSGKPPPSEV